MTAAQYCSRRDVKVRLQIADAEVRFDDEIDGIIAEVQIIIDSDLAKNGLSVPTPVPALIRFACADLATSHYKLRRMQPEKHATELKDAFQDSYEQLLEKHILSTAPPSGESSVAFIVGES